MLVRIVVVLKSDSQLPQLIRALASPSCLASRLHRGQQQRDQHPDDGNYYQQLHERETM
jgi:hypothetical protein